MSDFKSLKDILREKNQNTKKDSGKYVSREFQDYGYRLASELGDLKHKSLYIKLAKETPRTLLEEAKSYVLDYPNAKKKGAIFMWKLKELKGEKKN
jgi:hypothetical protein